MECISFTSMRHAAIFSFNWDVFRLFRPFLLAQFYYYAVIIYSFFINRTALAHISITRFIYCIYLSFSGIVWSADWLMFYVCAYNCKLSSLYSSLIVYDDKNLMSTISSSPWKFIWIFHVLFIWWILFLDDW